MTNTKAQLRRVERILEISRELTTTVSLELLLGKIVRAALELTESEAASILLLDKHTGELRFRTATCFADQLAEIPVPVEKSIAGTAFSTGEPIITHDPHSDPRFYPLVEQLVGLQARSLLAVPLQFQDQSIGALEVQNKRDSAGNFDQDDVQTLTVLAAQAAVAIENARLVEDLRLHHDRLEDLIQQRTVELEARNQELDAFAHTVAHDLRNPLSLVLGFAELLEQDCNMASHEELQYYAQSVVRNGRKMSNIVDELLLLAGVRRIEVTTSPLNMAPIVAEAQRRLTHLIRENEAEIIVPDAWPVAVGYGPWIEEVWANYLSNAIMYGGSPPRIELGADVQADGMVRFWVRDYGPGISADQQQHLFIPFTQLAQSSANGHGLGLSIVRRIMNKLGGEVGVESNGVPGQGSRFFFTLPGVR
jgi:signal transduction histidine kinase